MKCLGCGKKAKSGLCVYCWLKVRQFEFLWEGKVPIEPSGDKIIENLEKEAVVQLTRSENRITNLN